MASSMSRYHSHGRILPGYGPGRERRNMGTIKDKAQSYFGRITFGHRNAVKRPWDRNVDRSLRAMIEHANRNGDCIVNTGDGQGYFRPIPSDVVDVKAYHEYRAKERSRIRSDQLKLESMDQAFHAWAMEGDHEQ